MAEINEITQLSEQYNRFIEDLKSDVKSERKLALQNIKKEIFDVGDGDCPDFPTKFHSINSYVLRCFADNAEVCRELSIDIISCFIDKLPASDYYLTYIIPAIVKRVGQTEIVEESEEVRLSFVQLVHKIIDKYRETSYLLPFFNDFTKILVKTVTDAYPKVKKESCDAIILLSDAIKQDFHMQCESFVQPVISNFNHQHFKLRAAAVQCIGAIVICGNAKCFEMSVTPMAEKVFDDCSPVRLQVTKEVGNWMLNYRDRYSYWHRMIPLLLTGMCDVIEENRLEAEKLWDYVGKQFMAENEEELKPQTDFLLELPKHYPPVPRPNLGCRTLAERNVGKIIPAILNELQGWQSGARIRSAQLLHILVITSETGILQHAASVTRCLTKGAKNDDPIVAVEIHLAAEYFGYFVGPEVWWKLLKCEIDSWSCLTVLADILKGSQADRINTKYLRKITKALVKLVSGRSHKKQQLGMLNVSESLMNLCGDSCQNVSRDLFKVLFTIYSTSETDVELRALCLLDKLRITIDCGSNINDLFCKFVTPVLAYITSEACTWTLYTADRCILETILIHTGPALGLNLHLLSPLLIEALTSQEIDAEVKLKLFTSLSSVLLNRDENLKLSKPEHLEAFLNVMLENAIEPNLVWAAGRTAEAIRTAAVCCLCAVLQDNETTYQPDTDVDFGKCVKAVDLFPTKESLLPHIDKLFPLLVGLIDDNSRSTRQYALRAVCSVAKLAKKRDCFSLDHLHKTYPVVLKRLDDTTDKVRSAAVYTLCVLFLSRPIPYDTTTFSAHLDALYSSMLIHLDAPEENYQKEILDALIKVSEAHPILLKKKVTASMQLYRNKKALEHLNEHLETLTV